VHVTHVQPGGDPAPEVKATPYHRPTAMVVLNAGSIRRPCLQFATGEFGLRCTRVPGVNALGADPGVRDGIGYPVNRVANGGSASWVGTQ